MKQFKHAYLLCIVALAAVLVSCHKDKTTAPAPTAQRAGLYLLNQGLFNHNNSTLSYYNYTTKQFTADQFMAVNNRGLGDTGNDLEVYGSKMYIVVNVSSTVEVVDAKTAKSIKQIPFQGNSGAKEPRSIAFYKNMAFVTAYDNTVSVIDTATLTITKTIPVGRSPEQLAVSNGKLYVANSGGLDYPNFDKTISVIDLNTLTVTKTITVAVNPQNVKADAYGDVYVISAGDYGAVPNTITIIDSNTDQVKSSAAFDGGSMIISGDNAYFITSDNKIKVYNVKTETVSQANFITDGTTITTPYGLAYDSINGELFVTDAKDYTSNGSVFAFDKTGKKEYTLTAGINPSNIAFVNK